MIPKPALERLCRIYTSLEEMDTAASVYASSRELEDMTGIPAHTLRKDISYLDQPGPGGGKYRVERLMAVLEQTLGLKRRPKVCVAGLGPLGQLCLKMLCSRREFEVVAGFDANINVIELTESDVDLFPSYELPAVARARGIELAVLTVADGEVEKTAARLYDGGVRGILNYTGVTVPPEYGFDVRSVSLFEELRILAAGLRAAEK